MLSDPGPRRDRRSSGCAIWALHSAPPNDDTEALPVPTSLLVDAEGKVLWMDQSENYQRRSGPEVVLAALQKHLD